MTKEWTQERRNAQAERCRKNKPWEHATGPKTEAGKIRASMNAYKGGGFALEKQIYQGMFRANHKFVKAVIQIESIKLIKSTPKQLLIKSRLQNQRNRTERKYERDT